MKGSQVAVKQQFYLAEGDFLISKRQIVHGACGIVTSDFAGSIVSNEYSVLRCKPELDLSYLGYLSHSVYFQQTCFHSSIGVHIEKMIFKIGDWFRWPINLPTLPEQKKIAEFLGMVDAKLAALRAREAGLQAYKRGLMQALFSQRLRFTKPDGTPFPDWEEKRLGEVAEVIGGGTPDTDTPEYWNGDVNWFTPSEIKTKYLKGSARRITSKGLASSSAKLLPVGALILSTRATVGDVGITTEPSATNQGFQSLIMKGKHINEFWYYWLNNNKKAILRKSAGSTFLEIGKSEVLNLLVRAPHPEEQARIAETLSAMDAKILSCSSQVTQMEAFKKGLLQQMFV